MIYLKPSKTSFSAPSQLFSVPVPEASCYNFKAPSILYEVNLQLNTIKPPSKLIHIQWNRKKIKLCSRALKSDAALKQ